MRNAGLGLTGCGIKERVNISYKPGEIVTEERVMKAVQSMIDQSNAENLEFEISCPRVLYIAEMGGEYNEKLTYGSPTTTHERK
jgi:hypothetical protein